MIIPIILNIVPTFILGKKIVKERKT